MSEKLCVFCVHFEGDPGESCEICGHDACFLCGEGKNTFSSSDEVSFREAILQAEKCEFYKNYKDIK